MIIFMTVANHRGFGLALQDFRISPNPSRRLDGIVWGFEVAAENLDAATAEAQKQNLRWERVADYPASSPIKDSLFVLDPDGETSDVCAACPSRPRAFC